MAVKVQAVQCSDPFPRHGDELVSGMLTPYTPVDQPISNRVQEEIGPTVPSELVLPRPLNTHFPQQETDQPNHSLLRVIVHGNVIHITQ